MQITDFNIYQDILYKKSGFAITPEKSYLLETRLKPIAQKHGYTDLTGLTAALRGFPPANLVDDVVDAMTTNETFFFRDNKPFDTFKDKLLPHLMKTRTDKKLRIWCAACSSGQEPYSLAMILREKGLHTQGWNIEIKATDISREILAKAQKGLYSQFEVQRGMPIQLLVKYFTQTPEGWTINDDIKRMVNFGTYNLLNPMSSMGKFDIIFCRNVLIYFDPETKKKVLDEMAGLMKPDTTLLLGGAETVLGINDKFRPSSQITGVYVLANADDAVK
jgi:chemotaxis protein methyltransferase CheR